MLQLTHLLVIVDRGAPSFCYYENPETETMLMPIPVLEAAVLFSIKNLLHINLICGVEPLPQNYEAVLKEIPHTRYMPSDQGLYEIINYDSDRINEEYEIVGLRIAKEELPGLYQRVKPLLGTVTRINVALSDIINYSKDDYLVYQGQLDKIIKHLPTIKEKPTQINIISDRLLLSDMNNCEAGLRHVTLAPNGRFYICPGFYYEDENDDIGSLHEGIHIPNQHLLRLDYSPICSICDCFHCRRCVHLNRLSTYEVNIPSEQQCRIAHLEREHSRLLALADPNVNYVSIPSMERDDPIVDAIKKIGGAV